MKKECEHQWQFRVPYRPNDSDGIIHVNVEAHCLNCGEVRSSDYSWDMEEYHSVDEEGWYDKYECNWCRAEMEDEGDFREEIDDDDIHICSEECYKAMYGEDEEE